MGYSYIMQTWNFYLQSCDRWFLNDYCKLGAILLVDECHLRYTRYLADMSYIRVAAMRSRCARSREASIYLRMRVYFRPHTNRQEREVGELMMFLLAVFLLLVAAAVWKLLPALAEYRRKCRLAKSFPGWPANWLLGNLLQYRPLEKIAPRFRDLIAAKRYKVTRSWLGPFRLVINIHHPDAVRQVLKTPKSVMVHGIFAPWLGDGLLLSTGKKWARNRRLLTPAFHFNILKPYVSVYHDCVQMLVENWTQKARSGQPVLVFPTMSLLSLDIILRCAFSYDSQCQNVGNKQNPYVSAVQELCQLIFTRVLNPLYLSDWVYSLTPAGRQMKKLCNLVHKHAERVITERRKALKLDDAEDKIERKEVFAAVAKQGRYLDFLDILLSSEDTEGNGLSDLEIRNEVDTFMFEGHDTTATGMSWTLYCLAKHPEHQQKIREEVNRVLDGRDRVEYEDLKQLQYTLWCIKEALRIYTPVPNIGREADEDIEVCGHTIPKGAEVAISMYSVHHHPDVWENPEEYDPLRFRSDAVDKRDPFAFLPFSAGSRNCIGQNFAMNEMKVVIATLMQRFQVSLENDDGKEPELIPPVILRPKNKLYLKVELL